MWNISGSLLLSLLMKQLPSVVGSISWMVSPVLFFDDCKSLCYWCIPYLNFYFTVKCIYASVVVDSSIFGKGISFLFCFSGLLVAITFWTFCMISQFTILPNWLFSHHFPKQCLLLLLSFQTCWEIVHQRANSFLFACCFILYLIAYLFFTFIYLCW